MDNAADAGAGNKDGMVRARHLAPASAAAMHWGVKASFLSYVKNSGGKTAIVVPAGVTGEAFTFPRAAGEHPPGAVRFAGGVAFSAHGGMMTVILAEPAIEASSEGLWLTIADTADITDESRRRRIAWLIPENSPRGVPAGSTAFTPLLAWSGVGLFGDVYAEGTALDPLVLIYKDPSMPSNEKPANENRRPA